MGKASQIIASAAFALSETGLAAEDPGTSVEKSPQVRENVQSAVVANLLPESARDFAKRADSFRRFDLDDRTVVRLEKGGARLVRNLDEGRDGFGKTSLEATLRGNRVSVEYRIRF